MSWVISLIALASVVSAPKPVLELDNQRIGNFKLRDFRGAWHALDDMADKKLVVVAFLGTECPLAKLYGPRLAALSDEYGPKGVGFLGINANTQDSITEIEHYARVHKISFPMLKDVGNVVADQFGAERTPEVFLLDANRTVIYRGRIDDNYGVGIVRPKATRRELKLALDAALQGRKIANPRTKAVGCFIGRIPTKESTGDITYSKQISRILQRRCIECHREGQIAPFALTSYDEVVGWAETIGEVIRDQRMPPWHANPKYGEFANDCQMPDEEKKQVYAWIKDGAPQGDPSELPEPLTYAEGWRISKPDLVLEMPTTFDVPADGEVPYKYFTADYVFKEDTYIQQAEARPGNRSVVHHIIAFVKAPGGKKVAKHGELASDWLVATAPGAMPLRLPDGMAKFVPKGSRIVFQMHYTPNGTAQTDRSSVGLVFADPNKVKRVVATDKAHTHRFVIPPHAPNHRVEASKRFNKDVLLLAFFPHMHLRGKSFRYTAQFPDGREQVLLDVPRYDFNWQNSYIPAKPLALPKGSTVKCVAHFDNSEENLANPDPTKSVRWGDQTWEEMMIGYFDVALADQDLTKKSRTKQFLDSNGSNAALSDQVRTLADSAKASNDGFQKFAAALRKQIPQLDRLCVTSVSGDNLLMERAAQGDNVARFFAPAGFSANTKGFAIARHAVGSEVAVHQRLRDAKARDLKTMSELFGSSAHAPITFNDKQATVNFWSVDEEAFPEQSVKLLEQAAALLGK